MSQNKFIIPLKPCPWCKKTPNMYLPIEGQSNTNGTWTWHIYCSNGSCKMRPKSPYVSIRNTTKKSYEMLRRKFIELLTMWNEGNDLLAYESKEIDLDQIIQEGK